MTTVLIRTTPFLLSFILAICLVPLVRRLARSIGLVDDAGGRGYKTHVGAVPYGGGTAIFLATVIPFMGVLTILLHGPAPLRELIAEFGVPATTSSQLAHATLVQLGQVLSLLTCGAALFLLGLVDDWRELNQLLRFAVQIGAATLLVLAVPGFRLPLGGTPIVESIATVVWIGAMTNAFNFLDNMDGLTAGVSSLSFVGAALLALTVGNGLAFLLCALLAGAAAGFMLYNFPRASVFMGDAGGLFLGFVAGAMSVLISSGLAASGWSDVRFVPLLLLAVPAYDLLSVIVIRLAIGLRPWMGDTNHISHRLVSLGLSRLTAVLTIHGLTALTTVTALSFTFAADRAAGLAFGVALAVTAVAAVDFLSFRYKRQQARAAHG